MEGGRRRRRRRRRWKRRRRRRRRGGGREEEEVEEEEEEVEEEEEEEEECRGGVICGYGCCPFCRSVRGKESEPVGEVQPESPRSLKSSSARPPVELRCSGLQKVRGPVSDRE
ncbi:unnamed protein product [Pleuronectes platessa]|uniref:Uncharacterized protein n=1 Tax=Pleuronectes platessa TaxID=8262 RepID=A0A9N7Y6X3_PLEPL|nr:unnamed protein product [Pleuronectes platessa]